MVWSRWLDSVSSCKATSLTSTVVAWAVPTFKTRSMRSRAPTETVIDLASAMAKPEALAEMV